VIVAFVFDANSLRYPWLRFLSRFVVYQDPTKGPISTLYLLCMVAYFIYPLTVAFICYTLGIVAPPVGKAFVSIWVYLAGPYRAWNMWNSRLRDWYREFDPRVSAYRFEPARTVASRYFLQTPATGGPNTRVVPPANAEVPRPDVVLGRRQYSTHVESPLSGADDDAAAADTIDSPHEDLYRRELDAFHAALAADEHQDSLEGAAAATVLGLIEPQLQTARAEHAQLSGELQQWADAAYAHGLLSADITCDAHVNRLRWRYAGAHPRGSYEMTIPYFIMLCNNARVEMGHLPAHCATAVPKPPL
jgi:hypothetical protein